MSLRPSDAPTITLDDLQPGDILLSGGSSWPVQPVLDEAKRYAGADYAYSELLMGAVAIMASEMPREKPLREAVRIALDYVDHKFQDWLNRTADKVPMTCVQVVTAAHWHAASQPANKYGIQVTLDGSRTPPGVANEFGSRASIGSEAGQAYQEIRSRLAAAMLLLALNP